MPQFGAGNPQDYLNALWSDYKKNGNKEMDFYYERLSNLFFHGLGAPVEIGSRKSTATATLAKSPT